MDSSIAQICCALVSFMDGVVVVMGVVSDELLVVLFSIVVSRMFGLRFQLVFFGQLCAM